jgi:cyclopropane fatty-acyl-phospholipid synthase-like methyltransferase
MKLNAASLSKQCKTMSISELASYYNISEKTINKYLDKFGLQGCCYRRDPDNLNADDISKIKHLSASLSVRSIAHILGIGNLAVSRALKA